MWMAFKALKATRVRQESPVLQDNKGTQEYRAFQVLRVLLACLEKRDLRGKQECRGFLGLTVLLDIQAERDQLERRGYWDYPEHRGLSDTRGLEESRALTACED